MRRQGAERAAINAQCKARLPTSSKKGHDQYRPVDRATETQGEITMIMQVHDELVFEVDADKAEALKRQSVL